MGRPKRGSRLGVEALRGLGQVGVAARWLAGFQLGLGGFGPGWVGYRARPVWVKARIGQRFGLELGFNLNGSIQIKSHTRVSI